MVKLINDHYTMRYDMRKSITLLLVVCEMCDGELRKGGEKSFP